MNEEDVIEGLPPSARDKFWMEKMSDLTAASITSVENAAKQLSGVMTVLQGIYTAVLTFSSMKEIPKGNIIAAVVYAAPILLWVIALFFILRVYMSHKYDYYSNSPDSSEVTFRKIALYKYNNLYKAYLCTAISFFIVLAGIFYWLYKGGTMPNAPVEHRA